MKKRKAKSPMPPRGLAAEWVPITDLVLWAKNPRKNDHAVPKVIESIKTYGFGAPIIARRANHEVIAGHVRLKAAVKLGFDVVPVRFLDVSEVQAHTLALADNKLNELASWDDGTLAEVFADIGRDTAVAYSGFEMVEVDSLLGTLLHPETMTLDDAFGRLPDGERSDLRQMTFMLSVEDQKIVQAALSKAKETHTLPTTNANSNALAAICTWFLNGDA